MTTNVSSRPSRPQIDRGLSLLTRGVRLPAAVVVGAALLVGATACTSDSGSTAKSSASLGAPLSGSPAAKVDPTVAWASKVCAAVVPQSPALPTGDPSNPVKYKTEVSTFLQGLSTALATNATSIQQVGAPPITGGADVLSGALSGLNTAKAAVDGAKTQLDAAHVTSPAELTTALAGVGAVLSKANYQGPLTDLEANPDLRKAIETAPECASKK